MVLIELPTKLMIMKIPFEDLPNQVFLLRQEIQELKELLKMKVAPESNNEYMDTKSASEFLKTTPVALRQRIYKGEDIPHMKKERLLYFKKSDLIAYLEADRVETDEEIEASLMDVFKTKKSK